MSIALRGYREACITFRRAIRYPGAAGELAEDRVQPAAFAIRRNHLAAYQRIAPNELCHEQTARPRVEFVGGADLFDTAGVHDDDPIR